MKAMQEKACLRVLIIEDSEDDLLLLLRELRKGRFQIQHHCVESAEDLELHLQTAQWDAILSDYNLPGFGALAALDILRNRELDIPFIIVSGAVGEETAVEAMRAGAHDYVMKGSLARLMPAIERELREAASRQARRDAEKAAFIAKEEAIAANRAKSDFLAQMSHEIRTPLGAILGFSELLLESGDDEDTRRETVEIILRNGQNLLQIVDEILDMSKVEAGKLAIENLFFSLTGLLAELENIFTAKAREKGLKLHFIFDRHLPKEVRTDPSRLRQILINIIGNAIKFTQAGHVSLIVRLANSLDGKHVLEFTVMDTGVGISAEHQSLLFKPFSQADSSISRRFGGTGLGLALSRQLARLLQGDLVLTKSEPGKGSTFTLRIAVDMKESVQPVQGKAGPNQASPSPQLQLSNIHVLLVDDSSDNRLLMTKILKSMGATVDIATNGREAIEKALGNRHDLILMDMQMPIMDGYAAARSLRELGFLKPIIALTANAMNSERSRCLEAGCDDFHPKPIDRPLLIDMIGNYVSMRPPSAL